MIKVGNGSINEKVDADDARSEILNTMSYGWQGTPSKQNKSKKDKIEKIYDKYGINYEDDVYDMNDGTAVKMYTELSKLFESMSPMNEARGAKLTIKANAKMPSEDLLDFLWDDCNLNITPKKDDTPIPWDADITAVGRDLTLEGGAGAGGYGYCEVRVPLKDINRLYDFQIYPPDSRNGEDAADKIAELAKIGWIIE